MSIKPVDVQVAIPKSVEISKTKMDEQKKDLATEQQMVANTQKKVEQSLNRVMDKENAQKVHVREKQKDGKNGSQKGRDKAQNSYDKEKKEEKKPDKYEDKHIIDVIL